MGTTSRKCWIASASRILVPLAAPMLMISILVWQPSTVSADPQGYSFKAIAFLGDSPAGCNCTLANDFEPSSIQDGERIVFTADVASGGESVFLVDQGRILQIAHSDIGELGR